MQEIGTKQQTKWLTAAGTSKSQIEQTDSSKEYERLLKGFQGKYTQRQWDRTVGWGKVPDKYKI